MKDDAVVEALAKRAMLGAPAEVVRWIGESAVERNLSAWLKEELATVGSMERAANLRDLCPVPGSTVEDYLARVIPVRKGERALVHVRFRGGDPGFPFVQWVAGESAIDQPAQLAPLASSAMKSFARLQPRCMRIWIPASAPWEPSAESASCTKGMRWLAAPLKEARGYLPTHRVIRASAEKHFSRYASEYQTFLRRTPEAAPWTRAEPLETLRECESQGGFFALMEGESARGLVALRRQPSPWFAGWYVVDSLIFDEYRGQGLAAPMHRGAYAQLEAEPDDLVWGTIDPRNLASLATALAAGRVDIGGDWWIG